jgi:hypothetical protein
LESYANNIEIAIQYDSLQGPKYSLRIDGNGSIEYNGLRNVKMLGKQLTKISPNDLRSIIEEFENLYFFSFRDNYVSPKQSELQQPKTTISLRLGDRYKRIEYVEEGHEVPSELKSLVRTIEKTTKVDLLIGMNNNHSKY